MKTPKPCVLVAVALVWLVSAPLFGKAPSAEDFPSPAELTKAMDRVDALFPYLVRKRDAKPGEVELGRQLFFDPRLSSTQAMSCATCHQPSQTLTDGVARAIGLGHKTLRRNTPTLVGGRYRKFFFWDGRVSSIEAAALTAIQNPEEMNQDLAGLTKKLSSVPGYAEAFARIYGPAGPTPDNAASAMAAFIEEMASFDSPFDRFHERDIPMPAAAQRGLVLFAGKAGCVRCHGSPNFSSEVFYNVGLRADGPEDTGRFAVTGLARDRGAFRVPSLRNVALTPPYMHDGSLATLREVVDFFDRGGDARAGSPLEPLGLNEKEKQDLVAFLEALSSPPPPIMPPILPLALGPTAQPKRPALAARTTIAKAAPPEKALEQWDGLSRSIERRVIEGERAWSWSPRLPPLGISGALCMEAFGMDALLRKALDERWREKDKDFVEWVLLVMAERYYLYRAVAEENPERCAALASFDVIAGQHEHGTLDEPCREVYHEMRFAQALAGVAKDGERACVESFSHQPSLGYLDGRKLCGLLMSRRDDPAKACALFSPAYLDAHQLRACVHGLSMYIGDAATCENVSDLTEHLFRRCELFPVFRRALLAGGIDHCGASQPCRVLMGGGKKEAASIERNLAARACGIPPEATEAPSSAALEQDFALAQQLLERLPEPWRASRVQWLSNWRERYAALLAVTRRPP